MECYDDDNDDDYEFEMGLVDAMNLYVINT